MRGLVMSTSLFEYKNLNNIHINWTRPSTVHLVRRLTLDRLRIDQALNVESTDLHIDEGLRSDFSTGLAHVVSGVIGQHKSSDNNDLNHLKNIATQLSVAAQMVEIGVSEEVSEEFNDRLSIILKGTRQLLNSFEADHDYVEYLVKSDQQNIALKACVVASQASLSADRNTVTAELITNIINGYDPALRDDVELIKELDEILGIVCADERTEKFLDDDEMSNRHQNRQDYLTQLNIQAMVATTIANSILDQDTMNPANLNVLNNYLDKFLNRMMKERRAKKWMEAEQLWEQNRIDLSNPISPYLIDPLEIRFGRDVIFGRPGLEETHQEEAHYNQQFNDIACQLFGRNGPNV